MNPLNHLNFREITAQLDKKVVAMLCPAETSNASWDSRLVAADYLEERGHVIAPGLRVVATLRKYPNRKDRYPAARRWRGFTFPIWQWWICWSPLGLADCGLPMPVFIKISCHRARLKNRYYHVLAPNSYNLRWLEAMVDASIAFTRAIADGWDLREEQEKDKQYKQMIQEHYDNMRIAPARNRIRQRRLTEYAATLS